MDFLAWIPGLKKEEEKDVEKEPDTWNPWLYVCITRVL
jgi:hypothetical protein